MAETIQEVKYFYAHPEDRSVLRSHRIIIRKSKSNQTANFSLWNCELTLIELKKIFKDILCENSETYFKQDFKVIDDWGGKRKGKSHYIIIEEERQKIKKSLCFGVDLHDFDNDEIEEVLVAIFCNKPEVEKCQIKKETQVQASSEVLSEAVSSQLL